MEERIDLERQRERMMKDQRTKGDNLIVHTDRRVW